MENEMLNRLFEMLMVKHVLSPKEYDMLSDALRANHHAVVGALEAIINDSGF